MSLTETPISIVIMLATVLISISGFNNQEFKRKLLFNPYLVKEHNEWYRAFSHAFIHSDYMHLFFNLFVFHWAGTQLEILFTNPIEWQITFPDYPFWGVMKGRLYFITLYIGGFLFATLPAMRKHSGNPGYNSLGASGAVSAVLLGFIMLKPLAELHFIFLPMIPLPAFVMGILFFAYEKYMDKRGGTGIAHDAHIGGAVFGVLFLALINFKFILRFFELIRNWIGIF